MAMIPTITNFADLASFLAYLDPGSGSYVLQFLIASLLGLAFVTQNFWRRIKDSIARIFLKTREDAEGND